jgi:dTDP-4-dehydrorhamnose 3,5-epimerase-like enzyme
VVLAPRLLHLPVHRDDRGELSVAEGADLPFAAVRMFVVSGVPQGTGRGRHAQRSAHELLVCVSGACEIDTEFDGGKESFVLDRPSRALYVPPLAWVDYHHVSPATVLVALASTSFDPEDVIDDHVEFLREIGAHP